MLSFYHMLVSSILLWSFSNTREAVTTVDRNLCRRCFETRNHANVAYALDLILSFELNDVLIAVTINQISQCKVVYSSPGTILFPSILKKRQLNYILNVNFMNYSYTTSISLLSFRNLVQQNKLNVFINEHKSYSTLLIYTSINIYKTIYNKELWRAKYKNQFCC